MIGWIIGIGIVLFISWKIYHSWKKNQTHIDYRGYERDGFGRLTHRKIAYRHIYGRGYSDRFGNYDVHHIDGDKRNNSPENLQILTREEHKEKHGH